MQYLSPTFLWQQRRHVLWCGLIAIIAIELMVLLTLAMPALSRQMDRWGLLPRPQQMTELTVADASVLDRSFVAGQTKTVSFSVHNLEGAAQQYDYTVVITNQDRSITTIMDRGTVRLEASKATAITAALQVPADMGERVYVSIELAGGQAVGYWIEQGYIL